MFGYIVINESELKIREHREYLAVYCGVCHALQKRYGVAARLALNYDLTFLALLLNGLYDDCGADTPQRCPFHPLRRAFRHDSRYTDYAADMTVLLSYYQFLDHWRDEHKALAGGESVLLRRAAQRAGREYPRQYQAVQDYLKELHTLEQSGVQDPEQAAGLTGRMLAEIFVSHEDEWSHGLRQIGFYLGKFIYLMDAYDDVEKDAKTGCYNPFNMISSAPDFVARVEELLTDALAEAARAFERLPVLVYAEIIRNIIYSGVWSRFELLRCQREK